MNKIGLDLAYRTVGISIVTEDRLLYTSYDLSKERFPTPIAIYHMVDKVWETIKPYLSTPHILVMEEIFKGKWDNLKNIARVQGAVIDRYIQQTGLCPDLVLATEARNRLGIPGIAPKVAIQLWVLDTCNLNELKRLDKVYKTKIEETIELYYKFYRSKQKGDRRRVRELEAILEKQTLKVAELTGLDNHMADAIVLALGA